MSIGKNAIKRVENNGYSKVKTSAPDMENSSVIAAPDPQVTEKLIAPVENAAAVKSTTRKPRAKKAVTAEKKVDSETVAEKKSTTRKPRAKKAATAEKKAAIKTPVNATKKSSSNPSADGVSPQKRAYRRRKTENKTGSVQLGKDLPYYLL